MQREGTLQLGVANILQDGLVRVLPESILEPILIVALEGADLEAPPSRGPELRQFLEGPLYSALEGQFGERVARLTLKELKKVLAKELAGPSPSSPPPRRKGGAPKAPPPTDPSEPFADRPTTRQDTQFVFNRATRPVARQGWTQAVVVTDQIDTQSWVTNGLPDVSLRWTRNPPELLKLLETSKSSTAIVILDFRRSTIDPVDLASWDRRYRLGLVILWGDASRNPEMQSLTRERSHWIQCNGEASPEDLGLLVQTLLQGPSPASLEV